MYYNLITLEFIYFCLFIFLSSPGFAALDQFVECTRDFTMTIIYLTNNTRFLQIVLTPLGVWEKGQIYSILNVLRLSFLTGTH